MRKFIILIPLLIGIFSIETKAQNYFPFTCGNEKPFTEKDFKKWVDTDVNYIITKAEKKALLSLKTDKDRNTFIENFWLRRDPDPDTEENEFRVEYCERVSQTDQFTSGIPGWKTDRGLIHILYGNPDSIERGRTDFGNLKNVLFEKWKYKRLEGFCSNVSFTFADIFGNGDYALDKENRRIFLDLSGDGLTVNFGNCPQSFFYNV